MRFPLRLCGDTLLRGGPSAHVGDTRLESSTHIVIVDTLAGRAIGHSQFHDHVQPGRRTPGIRSLQRSCEQREACERQALGSGRCAHDSFTETQLALGSSVIPIGAYTVYPIPAKGNWSLVVNKNVAPGAAYDEKQDIAHAQMETAQVDQASTALEVAFAHVGSRCTLRIYAGQAPRSWTSWQK